MNRKEPVRSLLRTIINYDSDIYDHIATERFRASVADLIYTRLSYCCNRALK